MAVFIRLLIRFFLPALILYYLYKLLINKEWFFEKDRKNAKSKKLPVKDMKKDPVCGIYIPESEAKKVKSGGVYYYFCSDKCRKKFIELKKSAKEERSEK